MHAEYDGDWWVVDVPELASVYTQVRRLDQAEAAIREVIDLVHGIPEDAYALRLEPELPAPADKLVVTARKNRELARHADQVAADATLRAARDLSQLGLPLLDIATLVGLSFQRVQQILPGSGSKGIPKNC